MGGAHTQIEHVVSDWRAHDRSTQRGKFEKLSKVVQLLLSLSHHRTLSGNELLRKRIRFPRCVEEGTNDAEREVETVRYLSAALLYAKAMRRSALFYSSMYEKQKPVLVTASTIITLEELNVIAGRIEKRQREILSIEKNRMTGPLSHDPYAIAVPGMRITSIKKNISILLNHPVGGKGDPVLESESLKLGHENFRRQFESADRENEPKPGTVVLDVEIDAERRALQFLSNVNARVASIAVFESEEDVFDYQIEATSCDSPVETSPPTASFSMASGFFPAVCRDPSRQSVTHLLSPGDLVITVFSDILFSFVPGEEEENAAVEVWANAYLHFLSRYINQTTVSQNSEFPYLGVCFETLTRGFGRPKPYNISANLLLLSLTRGYKTLMKMNAKFISTPIYSVSSARVAPVSKLQDVRECLLGATKHGITVRTTRPRDMMLILATLLLITISYFCLRISKAPVEDVLSTATTFLSVSLLLSALYMKVKYRKWELVEALRRERTAKKLSELEAVLESRDRAIQIVASIEYPETVMSSWKSCAFTNFRTRADQGEFEIDIDLTVEDLERAGFLFGFEYNGNFVMADLQGKLRDASIAKAEKTWRVHVGGFRELHPEYILGNVIQEKDAQVGESIAHLLPLRIVGNDHV